MATLSILSYNLAQGLRVMKTNGENGGDGSTTITSNSNSLPKTFNKITVQNVLSESKNNALNISNNSNGSTNGSGINAINNANAIVKKIKDFGMIGTVNNASNTSNTGVHLPAAPKSAPPRKRQLSDSKLNKKPAPMKPATTTTATPAAKKTKLSPKTTSTPKSATKKTCENASQQSLTANNTLVTPAGGTPGRKGLPAPQAVARRNARERNRVKQVNNGFAALRERIPEEVAESFEAHGNGRNAASKKLSKVETLRMAVEYIRSLERLLGFDFPIGENQAAKDSFALIKDELGALSPGMDDQFDDSFSNYELDEDFVASHSQLGHDNSSSAQSSTALAADLPLEGIAWDLLPNITTLNGLQYIRIPGTNTYQLLTADLFAGPGESPPTSTIEDEQLNALIDTDCRSPRSVSSATTAADLHSSPTTTSIMQATTPALHQTTAISSADHVKLVEPAPSSSSSSSFPRSPVPQTSPSAANGSLQQRRAPATPPTLSPAGNELLLQTCAANVELALPDGDRLGVAAAARQFVAPTAPQLQHLQLQLPSHVIKQEFDETDYGASAAASPNAGGAIIYQTVLQHQQLLLGQTPMAMSPPLEATNSSAPLTIGATSALPAYFEQEPSRSFYESGDVAFKKELSDVMLDTTNTATATLSDESMIEAIDWWEAHTPQSDGGSSVIM